jgi:hypothetical protein
MVEDIRCGKVGWDASANGSWERARKVRAQPIRDGDSQIGMKEWKTENMKKAKWWTRRKLKNQSDRLWQAIGVLKRVYGRAPTRFASLGE